MNIFTNIFKVRFSAVERAILDIIGDHLDNPWKRVYLKQLEGINKIQRLANDKEVNFYHMNAGKVSPIPESLMLPDPTPEYCLASLLLVNEQANFKTRARVMVIRGRIFSIEFDKPPNKLGRDFLIVEVRLQINLSSNQILSAPPLDCDFPADYLDFVKTGDKFLDGWKVLALSNVRTVVRPDDNVYVLAEKDKDAVIVIRAGDNSGQLLLIDFQTGEQSNIGTSLLAYLKAQKA